MTRKYEFRVNGKKVSLKTFRKYSPPHSGTAGNCGGHAWRRPLHSEGLSCHPSQAEEFREKARKAGLTGVDYDKDGNCSITTRQQRKLLLKLRNGHDKDGGYGDG